MAIRMLSVVLLSFPLVVSSLVAGATPIEGEPPLPADYTTETWKHEVNISCDSTTFDGKTLIIESFTNDNDFILNGDVVIFGKIWLNDRLVSIFVKSIIIEQNTLTEPFYEELGYVFFNSTWNVFAIEEGGGGVYDQRIDIVAQEILGDDYQVLLERCVEESIGGFGDDD